MTRSAFLGTDPRTHNFYLPCLLVTRPYPCAACAPHLFQEVLDKETGTTYVPQVPLIVMNSRSPQSPPNVPNAWGVACRPTLLFVAAYALSITPHEGVHALTSYLLGFSSTLFQMWVDPDPARATSRQLATIAAAGPVFSLAVGVTCWLLYQRRFRRKPVALMFLMLAMVGVYSFLGPLAGSALGGDFNLAFTLLDVRKPVRYVASAMGFVLLPWFMFFMGGKLVGWAPSNFGRAKAVGCTTVAPWLIGTALILLIYWPLPSFLIGSTLGGSAFWLFAVVGAIFKFSTPRPAETTSSFTGWDFMITFVAVAVVRLLVNGVRLTH
jgi:hypothetical protein